MKEERETKAKLITGAEAEFMELSLGLVKPDGTVNGGVKRLVEINQKTSPEKDFDYPTVLL